ncbi:MAG: YggT family protein [Clostridia bacterium]|nr:YggT family protein [Clostridia bacterium]
MDTAIYLITQTAYVLISALELCLLARAILSWFDQTGESRVSIVLYAITEPLILPIRRLCERMHWFEGLPLDMPFMLTWLILMVIQAFMTAL